MKHVAVCALSIIAAIASVASAAAPSAWAAVDQAMHLYFMHFWADADALKLAQGLSSALEHVSIAQER